MEQESVEIFKPSVLGRVYSDLSKAHLIGKWLSPLETKKADRIIKAYDFTNWNSQIQPFELDMLFQVKNFQVVQKNQILKENIHI